MEQTEEDTRRFSEVIIHTIILALETLLALAGNSLVCVAIYRNRRLRTLTNSYVLSLAVADIMTGIFALPFGTIASGLRRWPFSHNFCQFVDFVLVLWGQVSTFILALVSINRYFCVVRPQKYPHYFTRKKTTSSIVAVWVFSFFLTLTFSSMPVIYEWSPYILHCRSVISNKRKERIFYTFFGCSFIPPILLTAFCYSRVYRVIRQHNNAVAPSLREANSQGTRTQEIKTCRVLFAAVFGYFICWVPFIVFLILEYGFLVSIPSSAQPIYPLFSSISAWVNPIIYGVMNRAMRKEFQNILLCKTNCE